MEIKNDTKQEKKLKSRKVNTWMLVFGVFLLLVFVALVSKLLNSDCPTCIGLFLPFILPFGGLGVILIIVSLVRRKNFKKNK